MQKQGVKRYLASVAAAAKLLRSCPNLCDPTDSSPPGSSILGFSWQEYWSGLPFPPSMHACMLSHFSCVRFCATPWTAAHVAPLSTGFSKQGYWSGLPFPETWSNRQIWPWSTKRSRAKANRVLPRECTDHSKHPLPTTQEKMLHMDITRWSTLKSDWSYSLQLKIEKLFTVSKNKTRRWLWHRLWTPYCQIQT